MTAKLLKHFFLYCFSFSNLIVCLCNFYSYVPVSSVDLVAFLFR